MGQLRMKIRIGSHEFDAEGEQDVVEKQFEAFGRLIQSATTEHEQIRNVPTNDSSALIAADTEMGFRRFFSVDSDILALTAPPHGDSKDMSSALLILYGHKLIRGTDLVSADDLLNGLKHSGIPLERADRLMKRAAESGWVVTSGIRRGKKYRLTIQGTGQAQAAMKEMSNVVS